MPNILNKDGLQVKTRQELLDELTAAYQGIYGSDINLGPDTPDGQLLNIFIQSYQDVLDLLVQVYTSFDPDQAVGKTLDQRVAINGIQRQAGTNTITDISIVTNKSLTLYGLDQTDQEVYTVADNEGNRFQLISTQNFPSAGTFTAQFQAEEVGEVLTLPNTITTPVTIVLGVESVNNPTTYSVLGINEEKDSELKERRRKSVSLASQGFLPGLKAALDNINGVTSAFVYENNTTVEDADGIPGNSIWVIVNGSGDDEEIARAIYRKRGTGAGMRGETTYTLTQVDGTSFVLRWDKVTSEQVFVFATVSSIDGVNSPNLEAIREELGENLFTAVNEDVNQNYISSEIQKVDDNALVTNVTLSTGKTQKINFSGAPSSGSYKVSFNGNESDAINYNDDAVQVQAKIRNISGLGNIFVSGSAASQEITIDFETNYDTVSHLLLIKENTTDVGISTSVVGDVLIKPTSKKYQFIYSEPNIILYNIVITPGSYSTPSNGTKQFEAFGGYGELTFEIETANSGSPTITEAGFYTAGNGTGLDTIKVTDERGQTTFAEITVV